VSRASRPDGASLRHRLLVAAALVALAAGCTAPPQSVYVPGAETPAPAAVEVGKDEQGEACRYQAIAAAELGVPARRAVALYCGSWAMPVGRIFDLSTDGSAPRPEAVLAGGGWRSYLDERFICGTAAPARMRDGASALVMQCTRRNGGWPHVALTRLSGDRLIAADFIPAALPTLDAVMAGLEAATPPATPLRTAGDRTPGEIARLIARRAPTRPFGSGDLQRFYDLNAAGDAYNNVDDPANAELAFREALALQQRILGVDNPGNALTLMKLAAQIAHQRNAPEANRLLDNAAALTARSRDPLLAAELDYYRAVTAAYQQRPADALRLAGAAEQGFARLLPPDVVGRANRDLADRPLRAGGIDPAVLTLDSIRAPSEETAIMGLAESLRLRAQLARKPGEFAASNGIALQSDRLLEGNGLGVSSTGGRALRLVAANEAGVADYGSAGGYSSQAGLVFREIVPGERPEAVNALRHGEYLLQRGRRSAALADFRVAGAILKKPGVVGVSAADIAPWLDALQQEADDHSAERPALTAEMFEAAQFAMGSRTALDIAQATARLAAGDPKAEAAIRAYQNRGRDFDSVSAERDAAVAAKASAERLAEIDARIATAQKARDDAEAVIAVAAPRYAEWSEKPVPQDEMAGFVDQGEAIAYFFVSSRGSYGFLVKRGGITAYRIPLDEAAIGGLIGKLRDSTVARPAGLPNFDFADGYRLYAALFGPVAGQLDGVSEVTVVATGDLVKFPLAALVTEPGITADNGDYRRVPWLVRRVALSYVPSPRIFVNLRRHRGNAAGKRPFIGFGDFRPSTPAQLAASFPPDRCRDDFLALRGLERLPDTREEVTAIGQRLGAGPGDIVLGDGFTKSRLASSELGRYRFVLLASHALLPEDLKCQGEPSLVVSSVPAAPSADPSFLRVADVEKLKLDADLVVLSACNTAGPSSKTGESLSGLARAFFRGGAHGVLVTHWTIVAGAAVPLMTGTFASGGGGTDTAQSLRRAQLQMIDTAGSGNNPIELSYPNYWAAFALIGDGARGPLAGS
jgi:CHAT domain-containing protein